ncbi:hypothetical protein HYT92_03465, partial [Candidatus Pacearchaeota archaeon]|nr:hypothetical protein [Candidatus Pacearchaeota archaeon]
MNRDFSEFRELLKKDPPVFLWSSDGPVLSKNEGWWADFVNFANEHARTNTSGVIK